MGQEPRAFARSADVAYGGFSKGCHPTPRLVTPANVMANDIWTRCH